MSALKLFIANKNYSSWSFRPWLAMKVAEISFEECFVRFDDDFENMHFLEFSPAKTVPTLHDGNLRLPDSLAILEYVAELYPEKALWPEDPIRRAQARAISCEMHSGFSALRSACPMNMRRPPEKLSVEDAVRKNVTRIEQIWEGCLTHSGGPFLFGTFGIADAMYAPVVSRFLTYQLSDADVTKRYTETLTSLPAWQEWEAAGRAEPWTVPADEI